MLDLEFDERHLAIQAGFKEIADKFRTASAVDQRALVKRAKHLDVLMKELIAAQAAKRSKR